MTYRFTLPQQKLFNNALDRFEIPADGFTRTGTYKVLFYASDIWQSVSLPKQVYVHKTEFREKAILVVGVGDYGPNQPWYNGNELGRKAYITFQSRWFGRDDIYYLNPNPVQDIDGNGFIDDVDETPTWARIQNALATQCANADKVTVYLIGQGNDITGFRLDNQNNNQDWLSSTERRHLHESLVLRRVRFRRNPERHGDHHRAGLAGPLAGQPAARL